MGMNGLGREVLNSQSCLKKISLSHYAGKNIDIDPSIWLHSFSSSECLLVTPQYRLPKLLDLFQAKHQALLGAHVVYLGDGKGTP